MVLLHRKPGWTAIRIRSVHQSHEAVRNGRLCSAPAACLLSGTMSSILRVVGTTIFLHTKGLPEGEISPRRPNIDRDRYDEALVQRASGNTSWDRMTPLTRDLLSISRGCRDL